MCMYVIFYIFQLLEGTFYISLSFRYLFVYLLGMFKRVRHSVCLIFIMTLWLNNIVWSEILVNIISLFFFLLCSGFVGVLPSTQKTLWRSWRFSNLEGTWLWDGGTIRYQNIIYFLMHAEDEFVSTVIIKSALHQCKIKPIFLPCFVYYAKSLLSPCCLGSVVTESPRCLQQLSGVECRQHDRQKRYTGRDGPVLEQTRTARQGTGPG